MLDYLAASGIRVGVINPANVNRAAFQAGLISDGDAWVKARKARNIVSHEYGLDQAARIAEEVAAVYLPLLNDLEERLEHERRIGN
jgi:nucleotidyltransferase substrate binding protein (TIGR01987 family)